VNILPDSRELIDTGVQTKPELFIDLSSTSFDVEKDITSKSILDVLPQNMEPVIIRSLFTCILISRSLFRFSFK
jgi:hypothetical protein